MRNSIPKDIFLVYRLVYVLILLVEVILAVPLVSEALVMSGSTVPFVMAGVYFIMWVVGGTDVILRTPFIVNMLGISLVFIGIIPIVSTIAHIVLVVLIIKYLLKEYKIEKDIAEDFQKRKESGELGTFKWKP